MHAWADDSPDASSSPFPFTLPFTFSPSFERTLTFPSSLPSNPLIRYNLCSEDLLPVHGFSPLYSFLFSLSRQTVYAEEAHVFPAIDEDAGIPDSTTLRSAISSVKRLTRDLSRR